jgi:hypothetical protein
LVQAVSPHGKDRMSCNLGGIRHANLGRNRQSIRVGFSEQSRPPMHTGCKHPHDYHIATHDVYVLLRNLQARLGGVR